MDDIILDVQNLKKYFPIRGGVFQHTVGYVKAVDGISFQLKRGKPWALWANPDAENPLQGEQFASPRDNRRKSFLQREGYSEAFQKGIA